MKKKLTLEKCLLDLIIKFFQKKIKMPNSFSILIVLLIICNQIISQNCRYIKNEINPITNEQTLHTRRLEIITTMKPFGYMVGSFILENDSISFYLDYFGKKNFDFNENDNFVFKFDDQKQQELVLSQNSFKMATLVRKKIISYRTEIKCVMSLQELVLFTKTKLLNFSISNNSKNRLTFYRLNNSIRYDILSNARCFYVALKEKGRIN